MKSILYFGNSNVPYPERILPNLEDRISSKRSSKYIALWNLSINCTWKNIKTLCKSKKIKYQDQHETRFKLLNQSYFVSGIRDYFDYVIKKQGNI